MNKLKLLFKTRKVEIWRFLKGIKSISKYIAYGMLYLSTCFTLIISWVMATNAYKLLGLFNENYLYLEVYGNIILIPLKLCFVFLAINIFTNISMRLIANKMDEEEMIKAGMKSPIIKIGGGVRLQTDVWKENAKEIDNVKKQIIFLKSWMRTIRTNPYIGASTKIDVCNSIKEIYQAAEAYKLYYDETIKNDRGNENKYELSGYRIWDKLKNKMYYCDSKSNPFFIDCDGKLYRFSNEKYELIPNNEGLQRFIIMQSIAAYDLINNEIYEHDIISDETGFEFVVIDAKTVALYENGTLKFNFNEDYTDVLNHSAVRTFVLGNMHQGYIKDYRTE